jgi:hypothetical protein
MASQLKNLQKGEKTMRKLLGLVSMIALFTGLTVVTYAQLAYPVFANVPFAFQIQGKRMPAGRYSIREERTNPAILIIRNENNKARSMVILSNSAESMNQPERARLVFDKIGNAYFLTQVWPGGEDYGRQIPEAQNEHVWESAHRITPERTEVPLATR